MRPVAILPNLLTLGNAFCGLLALSKAIDALALSTTSPGLFYHKMETACWLVFLGMLLDAFDGKVARLTGGSSEFGAQLDSFADALTFGCAPALLAKVLIEHEGPLRDYHGNPRLHFIAAASFALMAILRLVRFNLETSEEAASHRHFKGLPSPAAAGALISTLLLYLALIRPELELEDGTQTPFGRMLGRLPRFEEVSIPGWALPAIAVLLPLLGLLMVSRVQYTHVVSWLTSRTTFVALVGAVFLVFAFFLAPIPFLFLTFNGFVLLGLLRRALRGRRASVHAEGVAKDSLIHLGRK
jgi:CDP-diacylglycerol--serine O-phosphatidyltransferase